LRSFVTFVTLFLRFVGFMCPGVSLVPDVGMRGQRPNMFEILVRSKMEEYTHELLERFTSHFIEHLNTQDASEDFHELLPEESVYIRRWNDHEVAHFKGSAYWSPRNLPQVATILPTTAANPSPCLDHQSTLAC
jgi:hypothetical protein